MNEIKNTAKLVKNALEKYPFSRNCDNYLYYVICKERLDSRGLNIDKMSLSNALLYRKEYGLPNFETCRRTRQKIQAEFPELGCNKAIEEFRENQEEHFLEYARGDAI